MTVLQDRRNRSGRRLCLAGLFLVLLLLCRLYPLTGDDWYREVLGASLHNPMDLIREIAEIFAVSDIDTQIIAASIRNPIHVTDCALAGADIATVPYSVIEQMTKHPLTDIGIAKFQKDYEAVFGK